MDAERLLRLYPRAWRDRYGEELLALLGSGSLGARQVIDLIAGAIDAWLSSDVRRATRDAPASAQGGNLMLESLKASCAGSGPRITRRDGLIGAAVLIGTTILFSLAGTAARRLGFEATGEVLLHLAFPGSVALSLPFTVLKGTPWRAQVAFIAVLFLLLVLAGLLARLT
jgi:hypothetical protein